MKSVVKSHQLPVPAFGTAALCALLMLGLCSVALGWGRKPVEETSVASHGATSWGQAISGEQVRRLDSLASLAPYSSLAWWESSRHPFMDSVLPGTRFLRLDWTDNRAEDFGTARSYSALREGKLYAVDALNRLLLDAGFTFDSTQMPTIAKVAVLFATLGKWPPDTHFYHMGEPLRPAPGFPAITFLSVKRGERHYSGGRVARGVWVECMLDGVRNRFFVKFGGRDAKGRSGPDRVMGTGIDFLIKPLTAPDLEQKQRRGAVQPPSGYPQDGWVLGVSGDLWVENDGGNWGHFPYFLTAPAAPAPVVTC